MNHSKRLDQYCDLMEEIKRRLDVVSAIIAGKCGPLPKKVAEELCYLQLRMTCELIAMACRVAHGDISGTRTSSIRKRYEADWIINMLEKLHPAFYPEPSKQHI